MSTLQSFGYDYKQRAHCIVRGSFGFSTFACYLPRGQKDGIDKRFVAAMNAAEKHWADRGLSVWGDDELRAMAEGGPDAFGMVADLAHRVGLPDDITAQLFDLASECSHARIRNCSTLADLGILYAEWIGWNPVEKDFDAHPEHVMRRMLTDYAGELRIEHEVQS